MYTYFVSMFSYHSNRYHSYSRCSKGYVRGVLDGEMVYSVPTLRYPYYQLPREGGGEGEKNKKTLFGIDKSVLFKDGVLNSEVGK